MHNTIHCLIRTPYLSIIASNDIATQTTCFKCELDKILPRLMSKTFILGNVSLGDTYHESGKSDWFGHQGVSGCAMDGRTGGGERGRHAQNRSHFLQVRTPVGEMNKWHVIWFEIGYTEWKSFSGGKWPRGIRWGVAPLERNCVTNAY